MAYEVKMYINCVDIPKEKFDDICNNIVDVLCEDMENFIIHVNSPYHLFKKVVEHGKRR